jgi:cold shock CspA family protein
LITFNADATDPDSDELTYSLVGEPVGATINPVSGVFVWTPDEAQGPGSYSMTVLATDNGSPTLAVSEVVTITVLETNQAPTVAAVDDQLGDEGDLVSLAVTAEDPDLPANALTFTATGLPPGLTIDVESGLISGSIGVDDSATGLPYTVEVTVTDNGDPMMSDSIAFSWTVSPSPEVESNEAPVISPIGTQYTDENTAVAFTVAASDADPIDFAAAGLPPGLAINSTTGVISGTVGGDAIGTHRVTVTVTDRGIPAMAASATFNWTVIDVTAAAGKEEIVLALDGFDELAVGADPDGAGEPMSRPIRRSLVVMGSAAAATTEALSWPLGLLFALLVGFATVGRVGLYPLLWRGDRHSGMLSFYDPEMSFGLIDSDEGGEAVFVHAHAFPRRQRSLLATGTRVKYRVLASDNRASAWGATMEPDHE